MARRTRAQMTEYLNSIMETSATIDEAHAKFDSTPKSFSAAISTCGLRDAYNAKYGDELKARRKASASVAGAAYARAAADKKNAKDAALLEDANFLADNGVGRADGARRLGYDSWDSLYAALGRVEPKTAGLAVADRLSANSEGHAESGLGGAVRSGRFITYSSASHGRGWRP